MKLYILRLYLRRLAALLPLYSRRDVNLAWCEGYFAALRVKRGQGGKFSRIA